MAQEKIWRKRSCDGEVASSLQSELAISSLLAQMLVARNVVDKTLAQEFLEPSLKSLLEPSMFKDMDRATARIVKAITIGEKIGIFGDYDVDGVCGTAILQEFLQTIKADVTATLPHRMTEGYGLSRPGIDRLHAAGARLLIAVDCGILAHEQVHYAKSLGFDVIIVDHHTIGDLLPDAHAVINPKRSDCPSGATYLCAAGLAFFLCVALRRYLRQQDFFVGSLEPDLKNLLDLVALATVCDVVPLVKDNRALVRAGLKTLKLGQRVGLLALMNAAGIDRQKISSTNLGFHLGPRINAAGRLEDASLALKLLMCEDPKLAQTLAHALDNHNLNRRAIEEETVKAVCNVIEADGAMKSSPVLVLHDEAWHPGVVGIVASRIAERYHRPAIIIGELGKGSGRSIKGVDLHDMVSKARHSLAGFGGHAHAIGVTLGQMGVKAFREDLLEVISREVPTHVFTPQTSYDAEIGLCDITMALVEDLARLEPFGAQNPYPVVRINHSSIRNLRRLENGHIKGELEGNDGFISFIGFRMDVSDDISCLPIDVLGIVEKNEWQGRVSLQIRLLDYKKSS